MNIKLKKQTSWVEYTLWTGLLLVLFFTELGTSVRVSMQQLFLKTGIKDAPTTPATIYTYATKTGTRYPYELSMRRLDGKLIRLSTLKGKVVFLNQWATWCPPCRAEMPAIEKLYQSIDTSKVAFVMLSLDENQQPIRPFITRKNFTFPVYVPAGPLPKAFAAPSIPTTLVLRPDGQIVQRVEGLASTLR